MHLPTCTVYPVLNNSARLIKLNMFAMKNWMCNNVTNVYICYISLILHLDLSKLSLYCMDQSLYCLPLFANFASNDR